MKLVEARAYASLINAACDIDKPRVHIMEPAIATNRGPYGKNDTGAYVRCRTGSVTHFLDTQESVLAFLQPILGGIDWKELR